MKMHAFTALAGLLIAGAPVASVAQTDSTETYSETANSSDFPSNETQSRATDNNSATSNALSGQQRSEAENEALRSQQDDANRNADDLQRRSADDKARNEESKDDKASNRDEAAEGVDRRNQRSEESQYEQRQHSDQSQRAQFTDQERTASWRFVERNGNWWYRTPMNTWMVRQNNQWRPYQQTAGYRGSDGYGQGAQQAYTDGQQYDVHTAQNAGYEQSYEGQRPYSGQQTSYTGAASHSGQHSKVGSTEWMCIDGRMRRVTVVSVSNGGENQTAQSPTPATDEYSSTARNDQQANPSDSQASTQDLTPPPAPQPGDASRNQDRDIPDAPSRGRLMQFANQQGDASASERTTVQKPAVTDDANRSSDSAARDLNRIQAPERPQPSGSAVQGDSGYRQDDLLGGPSNGLNTTDSVGGDAAPERR